MPLLQLVESSMEGLLRMAIGAGLAWIGAVEASGYGLFLEVVGVIFVAAGMLEVWSAEAAARRLRRKPPALNRIQPARVRCDIPVFYATTEGQTRRIAERLAALFRERGFSSRAIDVTSADADSVHWPRVQAAVVGASLHAHKHQRAAGSFVRTYAPEISTRPSAFFSVSLAMASEDSAEREAAQRIARDFTRGLEWDADEIACFAGRLAYTRYGWLTRFIISRIARRHGQPTDISRDYEYTNWEDVARMADSVVHRIAAEQAPKVA